MPNSKLPAKFQIFIFEARASLQTLLQSLKRNSRKSARIGNDPKQPSFTSDSVLHDLINHFLKISGPSYQTVYGFAMKFCVNYLAKDTARMHGLFTSRWTPRPWAFTIIMTSLKSLWIQVLSRPIWTTDSIPLHKTLPVMSE